MFCTCVAFLVVRNSRKRGTGQAPRTASMGPPSFGGGNATPSPAGCGVYSSFNGATVFRRWKRYTITGWLRRIFQLQWGHRLSAVETLHHHRLAAAYIPASMGPPSFGGGNLCKQKNEINETVELQWGHRLSAVETIIEVVVTSPPSAMLQWGHRLSAVETYHGNQASAAVCDASMGPPSFGGGNSPIGSASANGSHSFNGATVFRRWKLPDWLGQREWVTQLQWGHRLSAVETADLEADEQPSGDASMGPPSFGGGNRLASGLAFVKICSFNGATAERRWKQSEKVRGSRS